MRPRPSSEARSSETKPSIGKLQPAAHFSKHDSVWRLVNHLPRVALNKCRKDLYCVRREPRVRRYLARDRAEALDVSQNVDHDLIHLIELREDLGVVVAQEIVDLGLEMERMRDQFLDLFVAMIFEPLNKIPMVEIASCSAFLAINC